MAGRPVDSVSHYLWSSYMQILTNLLDTEYLATLGRRMSTTVSKTSRPEEFHVTCTVSHTVPSDSGSSPSGHCGQIHRTINKVTVAPIGKTCDAIVLNDYCNLVDVVSDSFLLDIGLASK